MSQTHPRRSGPDSASQQGLHACLRSSGGDTDAGGKVGWPSWPWYPGRPPEEGVCGAELYKMIQLWRSRQQEADIMVTGTAVLRAAPGAARWGLCMLAGWIQDTRAWARQRRWTASVLEICNTQNERPAGTVLNTFHISPCLLCQ